MIDKSRELVQSQAVEAWVESGMVGTCEVHTRNRKDHDFLEMSTEITEGN